MCRDCTKDLSLRDPTPGLLSIELSVIATVFLVDRSGSDQSGCLFSESAILNFRSAGARACEHFQGLALDGWELNFSEGRS